MRGTGWHGIMVLLAMAGWLGGCSGSGNWFQDAVDSKSESKWWQEKPKFHAPDPGQGIALRQVWRQNVAGSPTKYLVHPTRFVVSGEDLFVGTFQGDVIRMNSQDGRVLWKQNLGDALSGGVAAEGGRVFVGTSKGHFVALSQTDGREEWRVRVATAVASAPTVALDKVLFTTLDNRTYALEVRSGDKKWLHSSVPELLVVMGAATPTVVESLAFVGYSTGEVYALNMQDGNPVWTENLTVMMGRSELDRLQDVDAQIMVIAGRVFAVNHQGHVVSMDARTGSRIWERAVSAIKQPLLVRNRLILADVDGQLTAMNAATGEPLWEVRVSGGLLTAPAYVGGHILVADSEGDILSVNPESGQIDGLTHIGEPFFADPVTDGQDLYLWSNQGSVFKFSAD